MADPVSPRTLAPFLVWASLLLGPTGTALGQSEGLGETNPVGAEVQAALDELARAHEFGRERVDELGRLADWARKNKLNFERDRLWEVILTLDPDHREARKMLRYHRRNKEWVRSESYRVPSNRAGTRQASLMVELLERELQHVGPYRTRVLMALERGRRVLDPDLRDHELAKLLVIDPNDEVVRGARGEVRIGNAWLLEESATALERRGVLELQARESLIRVPELNLGTLWKFEKDSQLPWKDVQRTDGVRVLGTVPDQEIGHTARVTEAVGDFFRAALRRTQPHRDKYTIYLLLNPAEKDALVAKLPGIEEADRALLNRATGGWLGAPNLLAEWSPSPPRRLDGATRQTFGTLLMDAYGIDGSHGWAWEGVGLYLTHRMIGTRMTHFIRGTQYKRNQQTTLWTTLQSPGAHWLSMGLDLLESPGAPQLQFLFGRGVGQMRDEDLLISYVLAAYLIEGRPDELPRILERLGKGEHPVTVFEEELQETVPRIQARLIRWLHEVNPR